jgi:hypothetical protein
MVIMETTTTPKRTYQKHKEGFKIAVEHKLNTKLKPTINDDGQSTYPLYIDVRAKGQRTDIRSRLDVNIRPELLNEFLDNSIVKKLIMIEREDITESLKQSVELGSFTMSSWYKSYRNDINNSFLSRAYYEVILSKLSEILKKRGVRQGAINQLLNPEYFDDEKNIFKAEFFLMLLKDLGIEEINSLIELDKSFRSLCIRANMGFQFMFNMVDKPFDFINIIDFFTLKHVRNATFRKTLLEILEAQNIKYSDPLKGFVNDVEKFLLS